MMFKNKNKQKERNEINSTIFFFWGQIRQVISVNCFFMRRNFCQLERLMDTPIQVVGNIINSF